MQFERAEETLMSRLLALQIHSGRPAMCRVRAGLRALAGVLLVAALAACGGTGGGGNSGAGTPPNPAGGLAPETNPRSGTPLGGTPQPSPDAGANRPGATEDGNLENAGLERNT